MTAILVVLMSLSGAAHPATDVVIDGGASLRSRIVDPSKFGPPIKGNVLPEANGKYLVGWSEYDFSIIETGWYKFDVDATPFTGPTRFRVDPGTDNGVPLITPKEWVWMRAGKHVLRMEQTNWTGFPSIRLLTFKSVRIEDGPAFRLLRPTVSSFRSGECPKLMLEVGGARDPFTLEKRVFSNDNSEAIESISVYPSDAPRKLFTKLPCAPGDYRVAIAPNGFGGAPQSQLYDYTVFGVDRVEPKFVKRRLLKEIDLTATAPDFFSGETSVESGAAGSYRVTESHGFSAYQRLPASRREGLPPPSWFAYKLTLPSLRRPYILEVEYPDNEARTFVVAIRSQERPPLSFALETGVIWPLSNKLTRREVLFWSSSPEIRVVVMNTHDASKAAVSTIHLYEVEETTQPIGHPAPETSQLRDFRFWDEEGESFQSVVGDRGRGNRVFDTVDRWLMEAKFFGATSVSPTAAIYASQMYPSSLLSAFSPRPDSDLLRAILIDAERYGLRVMPQLSPRADEILTGLEAAPRSRLLLSRTGQRKLYGANQTIERPPYYNALDPMIQDWYVAVIGEFVDRYQSFPAFQGVDLRIMAWANTALNNLVSLDWGYDASTVARFAGESGLSLPPELVSSEEDDSIMAPRRYQFIMQNHRQAWVGWRCRKMYDLFARLRDRIRSSNPRLRLSVTVLSVDSASDRPPTESELEEAGIDISLLGNLAGVELVDGVHSYGNREGTEAWLRRSHGQLVDQKNFLTIPNTTRGPSVMMGMQYIEMVGGIVSSEALGFQRQEKEPWASAASNPPDRMYLERFATVLGKSDAAMLGDGGNGYVFGSEPMRQFLAQYRLLPAIQFREVASGLDAVSVWQKDKVFYVVNMTPFSSLATLALDAATKVARADGGGDLIVLNGVAKISLRPFELLVFNSNSDEPVLQVDARLSDDALNCLRSSVERLEERARSACRIGDDEKCKRIDQRSKAERASLSKGAYWNLMRLIEATETQTITSGD